MAIVSMKEKTKNFMFRCPEKLHAKIKALAEKEGRSVHTQVVVILEEFFKKK